MADWLAADRSEKAAERILDAAGELFTRADAAALGMNDIASAAGCSRATLYRYFPNRDALYTAYAQREGLRLYQKLTDKVSGVADPRERLIDGMLTAVRTVRETPALASWFASGQRPIGGEMAERPEVAATLVEGFVGTLGQVEPEAVPRRARWLVRIIISLLMFPGADEDEERAMLAEFVAPILASANGSQATQ
jgi:AcrR family transcriptional regulator